jgi:hypothetical protein
MIEGILGWLTGAAPGGAAESQDGLQLALTALLVEAAHSDDHFDEGERAVIKQFSSAASNCRMATHGRYSPPASARLAAPPSCSALPESSTSGSPSSSGSS